MQLDDNPHDPVWGDATFATTQWDDPTRGDGLIARLDFTPGLLIDTLHPFDGAGDAKELAAIAAAGDAEVAELLGLADVAPAVEIVIPGRFFRQPGVKSWAA